MDRAAFSQPSGKIVRTLQGYDAFVPNGLPRTVDMDPGLIYALSEADRALGQLAGVARSLPNPQLLIAPLSRREAVLSSRIEGTQASFSDLAIYEASGETSSPTSVDVREVLNYREAMALGLDRIESLPLSLRLVRELHAALMLGVRGQERTPGEFRTEQNWIGSPGSSIEDATFVPPPPSELVACLSDWESFLHEDVLIPPILKCALMHYQFEAIHPFLDGNGRIGRLLIVLFLCSGGHLPAPVLYLSPFFENNRQTYYRLLRSVSETSSWTAWLHFFTAGVIAQCKDAFVRSARIMSLHADYRERLLADRAPPTAHRLMDSLFVSSATTAARAAELLGVTVMSSSRAIECLVKADILREVTGRRRDRIYVATGLVSAIEEPTGLENSTAYQSTLLSSTAV